MKKPTVQTSEPDPIPTPETDALEQTLKDIGLIQGEFLLLHHARQMEKNCYVLLGQNKKLQQVQEKIKKLEEIEAEFNGHARGEKLSGNVVKEATYKGTATGIRVAINVLIEP